METIPVIDRGGTNTTAGFANIVNAFNPKPITIGGKVATEKPPNSWKE